MPVIFSSVPKNKKKCPEYVFEPGKIALLNEIAHCDLLLQSNSLGCSLRLRHKKAVWYRQLMTTQMKRNRFQLDFNVQYFRGLSCIWFYARTSPSELTMSIVLLHFLDFFFNLVSISIIFSIKEQTEFYFIIFFFLTMSKKVHLRSKLNSRTPKWLLTRVSRILFPRYLTF